MSLELAPEEFEKWSRGLSNLIVTAGSAEDPSAWEALCPAHGDPGRNLVVHRMANGHLHVACMAGCQAEEIWRKGVWATGRSMPAPASLVGLPSLVKLSEVHATQVEWHWHGYVPKGELMVVEGAPGVGKSILVTAIAAALTTGGMLPDGGTCAAGNVIWLTGEESLGSAVRPRLQAAGANLERVLASDDPLPLPESAPVIRSWVEERTPKLLVVDPLSAYFGQSTNSYKDADVRRALSPLVRMAREFGTTVLLIRHLVKSAGQGTAINAGGGSIGIIGAARVGLLAAPDPRNPKQVVLAVTKSNLGPKPASIAYTIEVPPGETVPIVEWQGEAPYTADQLVAAMRPPSTAAPETPRARAVAWLTEALSDGPSLKEHLVEAAGDEGISARTLERASEQLGVTKKREEKFGGSMIWSLPQSQSRQRQRIPRRGETAPVESPYRLSPEEDRSHGRQHDTLVRVARVARGRHEAEEQP